MKRTDLDLLALLRKYAIPHQIIFSKIDRILANGKKFAKGGVSGAKITELRSVLEGFKPIVQPDGRTEGPGALGELITCSTGKKASPSDFLGISAARWAILAAAGFDGSLEVRNVPSPSDSAISKAATAPS